MTFTLLVDFTDCRVELEDIYIVLCTYVRLHSLR